MSDRYSGRSAQSMMPALLLGMAPFLANFDVTAVVIALPTLARELGFDAAGYAWVMDAYSLAFTACLLFAGALADRYGRRRAMLVGNGIFALASLACGIAWDGPTLWGARALQGIGAAFIVTGGIALIANVYVQARARTAAFALFGVMSGVAMAFGPTIGGLVSSWIGWRWIFIINLPACALVAWGIPRLVAEAREAVPRPLDILGVVLFTAALTALVEALLHGRTSTSHMVSGLALSAVFLVLFGIQQRSRDNPILDPGMFVQRAMIGIAILLCAVSIGYWAMLVYLPLFFAAAFDWPSEVTGIALLTATLPMLFLPPLGGRLVDRLGWRRHFALALTILAAGNATVVIALISDGSAPPLVPTFCGIVAIGVGVALAHPQLSGAAVSLVPPDLAGLASAVTIVMRQAGFAVGIAVLGALLHTPESAISYIWLFSAAAIASAAGLAAALVLLPAPAAGSR
ncbi:MFS transporter [Bradyrhizobium archetypum]|uniref:MFS transporter n=1 Tax=Bradyrhizobium archetypum TaxID=2721160 RepID=A0A7Y4H4Y8_9BRAD|nr:MFS transporter [Bradyrhizobium archetypum]NOJ47483.1 MFS transporter [Bradyrhizobium archetypum]